MATDDSAPFRDIRPDLKDRLRDAAAKREHFARLADDYAQEIEMLTRLLEFEERRYPSEVEEAGHPDEALAEFVERTLTTRPMTKEDLRDYATKAGYNIDGRSIHLTLVNLRRTGRIKELQEGVFATHDWEPLAPPESYVTRRRA